MMNTKGPRGTSPCDQRASQAASVAASTPGISVNPPVNSAVALPDGAPASTCTPRSCQCAATARSVWVLPVPACPVTMVRRSGPSIASAATACTGLSPSSASGRSTAPAASRVIAVRARSRASRLSPCNCTARARVIYCTEPSGARRASGTRSSDPMTCVASAARSVSPTWPPRRARSPCRISIPVKTGRSAARSVTICAGCARRYAMFAAAVRAPSRDTCGTRTSSATASGVRPGSAPGVRPGSASGVRPGSASGTGAGLPAARPSPRPSARSSPRAPAVASRASAIVSVRAGSNP